MAAIFDGRLSSGAVQRIYNNDETVKGAILQAVDVKQVAREAGQARWRIVLSDGQHFVQCMLSSQLHRLAEANQLNKGCIVRLNGFIVNLMQNRRLVILLELDVVSGPHEPIGTPSSVEGVHGGVSAAPAGYPAQPARPVQPVQPAPVPAQAQVQPSYGGVPAQAQQPLGLSSVMPAAGQVMTSVNAPQPAAPGAFPLGRPMPIVALSPYQNRWTIKARVSTKSDIRHFQGKKNAGKLFNVELIDESGEIRCTLFNELVDTYYDRLQVGKVYFITRGFVKVADARFSSGKNQYEMTLNSDSEIVEVSSADVGQIPEMTYNFVSIADIEKVEPNTMIDVIGIVHSVDPVSEIITKRDARKIPKRDITLVDQSTSMVKLTLWGQKAEQFSGAGEPVLAVKGVRVSDFGGRSLSTISSSFTNLNPQIQEAYVLRGWYDQQKGSGGAMALKSISGVGGGAKKRQRMTIAQVQAANLGQGEKGDWFTITAYVSFIKKDGMCYYPACPSEGCSKKVTDDSQGSWRCEKCDKSFPQADYRYVLKLSCSDHTGSIWLSAFNDAGLAIMQNLPAAQLAAYKEDSDPRADQAFQDALFKEYVFRCIATKDTYNDQVRTTFRIQDCQPVAADIVGESNHLLEMIEKYKAMAM